MVARIPPPLLSHPTDPTVPPLSLAPPLLTGACRQSPEICQKLASRWHKSGQILPVFVYSMHHTRHSCSAQRVYQKRRVYFFSPVVYGFQIKENIPVRLAWPAAHACSRGPRQTAGTCSAASPLGPRTQRWRPRCRTCRAGKRRRGAEVRCSGSGDEHGNASSLACVSPVAVVRRRPHGQDVLIELPLEPLHHQLVCATDESDCVVVVKL